MENIDSSVMESQLQICRVCTDSERGGELVPIYEKSNNIALDIFLICGVKILEFTSELNKIPALICARCANELSSAMNFRNKCRKTDQIFRKSHFELEKIIWGNSNNDNFRVKQEAALDGHKIKDEPCDDFNVDLFENIDTVLEENHDGCEESNTLAGILKKAKREESLSDSSESGTDYECRKRRKLKNAMKLSSEFRDFDLW